MTKTLAIHSPQDTKAGRVVTLSSGGVKRRVWRKQILPLGKINYEGRQISFDSDYHKTLVRNFRKGAFPQVPFQLADATNTHTNDPDRTRGDMVDLRAEPDGLYGYFELGDPAVVLNNKKLGVSCRIIENYSRESDGQQFGHSLQHVLGTLDPRITGMKPWESVELASAQADQTLDLSASFYTKDGGEMPDGTEDKVVVELSTAQLEKLNALLADPDEDEADELDAIFDGLGPEDFEDEDADPQGDGTDEDEDPEPEDSGTDSVGLAAVHNLQNQVLELTNQLANRDAVHELEQLRLTGLAPAIIEAAAPLMRIQSGVIELANGDQVSPAKQVRTLLRTVLELAQRGADVVSFDLEEGQLTGGDSAASVRKSQLDELDKIYGS